jgi:hypothetical protein
MGSRRAMVAAGPILQYQYVPIETPTSRKRGYREKSNTEPNCIM